MGELTDEIKEMKDVADEEPEREGAAEETTQTPGPSEEERPEEQLPEEAPSRKFRDWDEAERAYSEAHADVTRTRQEMSDLRRRLYEMEQANKPKVSPDETINQITDKALLEIKNLPPEDPEREVKAGRIWAKAQREIASSQYDAREAERENKNRAMDFVNSRLDKAKMSEPGKRLFWKFAPDAPPYLSFDEQVNWTMNEVNQVLRAGQAGREKQDEREAEEKNSLHVLGRGAAGPRKGEAEKPSTLTEEIRRLPQTRQQRLRSRARI